MTLIKILLICIFLVKGSNRFENFVMIFIRQRENRKKIDTNPQASSITRKTGCLVLSLLGLDSLYSPLPPCRHGSFVPCRGHTSKLEGYARWSCRSV